MAPAKFETEIKLPDTGKFTVLKYVTVDDSGLAINPMVVRADSRRGLDGTG